MPLISPLNLRSTVNDGIVILEMRDADNRYGATQGIEGREFPSRIDIGFDWVFQADLKRCITGFTDELESGRNTLLADLASAGFTADWWSKGRTPNINLPARPSTKDGSPTLARHEPPRPADEGHSST